MPKINRVQLIVYDFDGVMTDNKLYVDQEGKEMVQVNRADGLGVAEIEKHGIAQIIISTEKNPVVTTRAVKLGIPSIQGVSKKEMILTEYCEENSIDLESVLYVGNDINDLEAMRLVGYSFCPADAHESIKAIADYTLKTTGGHGVIRELMDFIIRQKGE